MSCSAASRSILEAAISTRYCPAPVAVPAKQPGSSDAPRASRVCMHDLPQPKFCITELCFSRLPPHLGFKKKQEEGSLFSSGFQNIHTHLVHLGTARLKTSSDNHPSPLRTATTCIAISGQPCMLSALKTGKKKLCATTC